MARGPNSVTLSARARVTHQHPDRWSSIMHPAPDTPRPERVAYLVGGLRISVGDSSKTAGPRTHILGFVGALGALGIRHRLLVASEFPGLSRFARRPGTVFTPRSRLKVLMADFIRVAAMIWSGIQVAWRERAHRRDTTIIYERGAVFQSLASFHPAKRRAVRVVEANAVISRETARDRNAIVLERWAAAVERHVFRRADLVVAVSAAVKRDVVEFSGIPENRVLVLPNAASRSWTEMEISAIVPGLIGFAGSVGVWQRIDRVIEAIGSIDGARLEIVGDGSERERLRALAAERGLADRVSFTGGISHAEALEKMSRWSVGFAGHTKTWAEAMYHSPLKLYEYAALGMNIVCSPSGDAEQLRRDGVALHSFGADDNASLQAALTEALTAAAAGTESSREAQRQIIRNRHTWEARVREFLDAVRAIRGS
ncbi:glycosyltransferase [Microbacterium lushaniae]|nr:glycosyltransferase [Microbacterium lushaniae]KAA9159874.1 glycosyltransferase [Microbacterium lushaniae]